MTEAQQAREQMIELCVKGGMSREEAEAKFNNPSKLLTWSSTIIGIVLAVWFWVWIYSSPNVLGALMTFFLFGGIIMVILRVLAWGFTGSTKL